MNSLFEIQNDGNIDIPIIKLPGKKYLQLAAEAAARAEKKVVKRNELKQSAVECGQLPIWKDGFRCLPNEIVRSALFNARNRKKTRAYLKQSPIAVIGDGCITYTGEELRQDDETVWLQLIHMAKEFHEGQAVEFTPYSLCKSIKWTIDGGSYTRLRACLGRMQATSLSITSKRLKENVSLSMIPIFRWKDNETGRALRFYQVQIPPQLIILFGDVYYTQLEWQQRLALPVGIATWLHGYFSSHSQPYPIKIETLKRGAGLTTCRTAKVRELIEKALDELVSVSFLASWAVVGELVHVKRNYSV
jgi:hypothetical protein